MIPDNARATQVGGTHYLDMEIQPWEVIDRAFSRAERIGFYRGNAIKYLLRAGTKGDSVEDMRKCVHYLNRLVEVLEER